MRVRDPEIQMSVCACDRSRSIAWYDGLVVGIRTHGFMWWSGGVMPEACGRRRQSPSPLPVSGPAAAPGPNGVAHRGCRFGRAGTRQIGCGGLSSFRASCFETTLHETETAPKPT